MGAFTASSPLALTASGSILTGYYVTYTLAQVPEILASCVFGHHHSRERGCHIAGLVYVFAGNITLKGRNTE